LYHRDGEVAVAAAVSAEGDVNIGGARLEPGWRTRRSGLVACGHDVIISSDKYLPGGPMARADAIRQEVYRLIRSVPFQPFMLVFENGDQVVIEHRENIAFDAGTEGRSGSADFYILSNKQRVYSTF